MSDFIVDAETAEAEFGRFLDCMDISSDTSTMDDESREGFLSQKRTIINAIQRGHLIINDDGEPVYTPRTVDCGPITFAEPSGAAYMAMDRKKKGEDIGKMFAMMADITKQPAKTFANMKQRDLKVCQALVVLFLAQ